VNEPRARVAWLLNHYAQTPEAPGGTRHYWLSRYLRQHGWRVPIIASSVQHNTGRQRLDDGAPRRLEDVHDVTFLWLNTPTYEGRGLGRVRNMISYARRAQESGTVRMLPRPDVVVGSSVHPLAGWAALRLARRFGVPFIFEVRDLWPETLINFGMISRHGLSATLLRRLERMLYRNAARILTLLPEAWRYIERFGVPRERVVWIPNGVSLEGFPWTPRIGQTGRLELMYFGAHGQANDLETLLRAMAVVQAHPDGAGVRLRMIGDGPRKPSLRALAGELRLRSVVFEDPVAYCEISRLASEADAFVLTVLNRPELYRYGVSMNKLFDYLAAGRPIVVAIDATNNPVAEAGAGITVRPEDPQHLAEGILALARMSPADRARRGESGRRFLAERHDYVVLAARFASVLDETVASTGGSGC
jgi:glycosyltransferase involved in cell wall biosynthesis